MALSLGKKGILKRLSEIMDPELGINIVELGLIYEVKVVPGSGSRVAKRKTGNPKPPGSRVEVRMTLTSIGCPLAGFFAMQVEEKVKQMKGVKDVHVHIVWEPPWTPERMSEKAKKTLGMS